ncbi:hypothetical protein BZM27_38815 [Paraburkholderia steynii]|uniref:Schlafen AlbA-2 domain-containing protein n=1 Tax=Paraburkholderia steynii TaxID=1245441 RepID=A0A4R0XF96_9BURK|nr:hypothetical protein BZM27_38815 [Paraburkholderia steynii]
MFESIDEIRALEGAEAESVSLEFKHGDKLADLRNNDTKSDFIKTVTAFANAGGGVAIYGISEARQDGLSLAGPLAPVTNRTVTQDRLREIVLSNTDPVLNEFEIKSFATDAGNVFVITVEPGYTAYQNKIDQRFYQRIDASAVPMYCFAIRDVMNRRTTPHVTASFKIDRPVQQGERHVYYMRPSISNAGNLTASHWVLQIGAPAPLAELEQQGDYRVIQLGTQTVGGHRASWFELSSERCGPTTGRLLPGETRALDATTGFARVSITITPETVRHIETRPPIQWTLMVDNAPKRSGEVPYDEWCTW